MENKKQYEEPKMDIVLIEDDPVKAGPFNLGASDPIFPVQTGDGPDIELG